MIEIIAVICSLASPSDCREEVVASSRFAQEVSLQQCMLGEIEIANWMKERPGYRLANWKCTVGKPAVRS